MNQFPHLFALESNPKVPFFDREFFENGYWQGSRSWRRTLRGRAETNFSDLISLLSQSNFLPSVFDKWRWLWDPSGCFSVNKLSKIIQKMTLVACLTRRQKFFGTVFSSQRLTSCFGDYVMKVFP